MAKRTGGFIGQDGINAPDQATGVSASGGDAQATVSFTSPSNVGGAAVTGYRVQSNDGIGASGSASPITVTGLTNDTSYTFNVWAINPFGWSSPSDASGSVSPFGDRVVFGGGSDAGTTMDYISVATTGNAADFGDCDVQDNSSGTGSATRGIFACGRNTSPMTQYITYRTAGNAVEFGDFATTAQDEPKIACSNGTRAVFGLCENSNVLNYFTISSVGNATDFGNLTQNSNRGYSGVNSTTRGVIAIGEGSSDNVSIDYITIASTGNGTNFGDFSITVRDAGAGCSNSTRGLFAGGDYLGLKNEIQYVTIASTGNTTDFGDLASGTKLLAAAANATRGIFGGGQTASGSINNIQYVTISSTGNTADFGDLTVARKDLAAMSSAHGGLS